ncbi:MAG: DUF6776 family protein [Gammaproteobacteria bacterium]
MAKETSHIIVKSPHPGKFPMIVVLLLVTCIAGGWFVFDYGRQRAGFDRQRADAERDKFKGLLRQSQASIEGLRKQNARLTQAMEVDKFAYSEVEQSLQDLQNEVLDLKEELAFYRGIINPEDLARGLQIQSFRIEKGVEPGQYSYRVILTHYNNSAFRMRGNIQMAILGVHEGVEKLLSQSDFLANNSAKKINYRFKYFQELSGKILIPEGFVPVKVEITVIAKDRKKSSFTKSYQWQDALI